MKFTLSWLKEHLETDADLATIVDAMTMAGLEVEHVDDPGARFAAFSVAKVVRAERHSNADRLQVCQVETKDGPKEIVCGAPNARAGLLTVYAPVGTFIPGSGITLEPRPVRGVVSHGMLCSAAELEIAEDAEGIIELAGGGVGEPAASALGLEATIDFEVTPNRPDWLGVVGVARDLAAAGLGRFRPPSIAPIAGSFPCPIAIRLSAPDACPAFAGRLIRGVANPSSPEWLQRRLRAVGLRPINALADITNLITFDRARPLHVYDADGIRGAFVEARMGAEGETLAALDGRSYAISKEMCVIADGSGVIGLGGVIGGASTGCRTETTNVFVESAWFEPLRTAQTGRLTGIHSDAQYRFARGVDPQSLVPGVEMATRLILELCGGEASEVLFVGAAPSPPAPIAFEPSLVERLSGIAVTAAAANRILADLGFRQEGGLVHPPSWRRDIAEPADLVEEIARITGYGAIPSTPLSMETRSTGGVLTERQNRIRIARRALAAAGYQETIGYSFIPRAHAALFGGGGEDVLLDNPIAADLDCMRPSPLPGLIATLGRNMRRGAADCALFDIGPSFAGEEPADQRTSLAAILGPDQPRRWDKAAESPLFSLKADLLSLLTELGAPAAQMQLAQTGASPWWRPGRSARLRLGKSVIAEFGEVHPSVLRAMDVDGPVCAFEIWVEALPEPRRRAGKTRPPLKTSPFMRLSRDFAFLVPTATPAGDLSRAVEGADRAMIASARVFDVYVGEGVPSGMKSVALEAVIQPQEATLTEAEIEALSAKIIAAAETQVGAKLRG